MSGNLKDIHTFMTIAKITATCDEPNNKTTSNDDFNNKTISSYCSNSMSSYHLESLRFN